MSEQVDELCVVAGSEDILHTAECPHLGPAALAGLVPATPEQQVELPVCSSCRKVLDGHRAQRFTSFEAAMEAFQAPLENRAVMREIAAGLEFAEIWIPASNSYIGVAPARGVSAVAYFSRGFVETRREGGGYDVVELPVNWLRSRGRSSNATARLDDMDRPVCTSCWMALPSSGVCDDCG